MANNSQKVQLGLIIHLSESSNVLVASELWKMILPVQIKSCGLKIYPNNSLLSVLCVNS